MACPPCTVAAKRQQSCQSTTNSTDDTLHNGQLMLPHEKQRGGRGSQFVATLSIKLQLQTPFSTEPTIFFLLLLLLLTTSSNSCCGSGSSNRAHLATADCGTLLINNCHTTAKWPLMPCLSQREREGWRERESALAKLAKLATRKCKSNSNDVATDNRHRRRTTNRGTSWGTMPRHANITAAEAATSTEAEIDLYY